MLYFDYLQTFIKLLLLTYINENSANSVDSKNKSQSNIPVVLWHGMGDSCCFKYSLGQIKTILEENIPGVIVKSIRIGNNMIEDIENSYFKNVNEQVKQVCKDLAMDKALSEGYNAVGFSQGSQFLRAVAQRCPNPPMKNLISLGGQHQGVYGLPNCASLKHSVCKELRSLLHYAAYMREVQRYLVQAEYWHDPLNEETYKRKSVFLADINNELNINEKYRENLKKLENFVMVKFSKDTMVEPVISEWFGFYKPGQDVEYENLNETALYKEDRLGLKEMDKKGKLHFLNVDANHLQFTDTWFIENIIKRFLI